MGRISQRPASSRFRRRVSGAISTPIVVSIAASEHRVQQIRGLLKGETVSAIPTPKTPRCSGTPKGGRESRLIAGCQMDRRSAVVMSKNRETVLGNAQQLTTRHHPILLLTQNPESIVKQLITLAPAHQLEKMWVTTPCKMWRLP